MKEKELLRLVKEAKDKLSLILEKELPTEVKNSVNDIFNILDIKQDNDISDKEEVYDSIAEFLKENLLQSKDVCLKITHNLCGEVDQRLLKKVDERLLKKGVEINQTLIKAAKELVLTIKVHYESKVNYDLELQKNKTYYNRQTEIYYMKRNKPAVTRIKKELELYKLPQDVLSELLGEDEKKLTFKLYPKE